MAYCEKSLSSTPLASRACPCKETHTSENIEMYTDFVFTPNGNTHTFCSGLFLPPT